MSGNSRLYQYFEPRYRCIRGADHFLVEEATKEVQRKKKLGSLALVRFEAFKEGKAAQILHIGPFSEEGPTIEKVHAFIENNCSRRIGKHHEIYLSDIRRAAPEKWKTIIRQPMS